MIAFGSPISDTESYTRYARRGIELAAEADSPVFAFAAVGHISRTYNLMLDKAAELEGLEALVLAHPHAQITDPAFCDGPPGPARPRRGGGRAQRRPRRAQHRLVGGTGQLGAGDPAATPITAAASWPRSTGHGRTRRGRRWRCWTATSWCCRRGRCATFASTRPWRWATASTTTSAAASALPGGKLVTADLRITRHQGLELFGDPDLWVEKHIQVADRWTGDGARGGLGGACAAGGGRARGRPGDHLRQRAGGGCPPAAAAARARRRAGQPLLEAHGAAAGGQPAGQGVRGGADNSPAPGGSGPWRPRTGWWPRRRAPAGARGARPPRTRWSRASAEAPPPGGPRGALSSHSSASWPCMSTR